MAAEEFIAIPMSEYEHLKWCKQRLEEKMGEDIQNEKNAMMEQINASVISKYMS